MFGLLYSSRKVASESESGKTGHETGPRRGLGVVETQAERKAAGDGSPATKEEKTSQCPIKASYEYQASTGYQQGPGVRIQRPTGSGRRPLKGQDGVL